MNLKTQRVSIHPLSDTKSNHIGDGTTIWQFSVILKGAIIGKNCNINCHTFIENDVVIGDNVTLKSGVYIWDGITIKSNVFIGPNVTFTNDKTPRSKKRVDFLKTIVEKGASIGANATILGGITVGAFSMIGMGAVVTKDVPSHALVFGNPATIKGWVDEAGHSMKQLNNNCWKSTNGDLYQIRKEGKGLIKNI